MICPHVSADDQWDINMEAISDHIRNIPYQLTFIMVLHITHHLQLWRDASKDIHLIDTHRWTPITGTLLEIQNEIGWRLFVDGCVSIEYSNILNQSTPQTQDYDGSMH